MTYDIDTEALLRRLETITMEEASIGADDGDARVLDEMDRAHDFSQLTASGELSDGGDLDDALRVLAAVWPAGREGSELEFRWASIANDERFDRIVLIATTTSADGSRRRDVGEVVLGSLGAFPGGPLTEAVPFLLDHARRALGS